MLWLYLLGIVTLLGIVLRRVLRRMTPLNDALYSKSVAIEYVHTGVAWVGIDDKLRTVNPALASSLEAVAKDLIGHDWCDLFVPSDRERVRQAYTQMLLMGRASVKARGVRLGGTHAWFEVLLLAVHDHKMRFIGHHCLTDDRTREHELEERIEQLTHTASMHRDTPISA